MAYESRGATDPNAPPDPSTPSSEYKAQSPFWDMIDAILGGEPTIKAGRELYLPRFAREKPASYDYRLSNAPFTGIYSDISKSLASKPFSKELALKEGSPSRYVKLSENIDGQGNNLHVFAAAAFKDALDKGISWILVDYTKVTLPADRPLSIAEESGLGVKAYWVHVCAQQMIAVYSDFVDGVEVIHDARIRECSTEVEGFSEEKIERVRHFNRPKIVGADGRASYGPAIWSLWRKYVAVDGTVTWEIEEEGTVDIGIIPLVPIVLTKRANSSWLVDPALRDLAYAQIAEYRQEANLEWIKIMTCYPMLCVSGMTTDDGKGGQIEITVGPNTVFNIPQNNAGTGPAGTVGFIEPSAQSIVENRAQLELTRKEMRDLGMQPLAQANLTVTLSAHLTKKASSAVQAWAFLFKDAIELAWLHTAKWFNDVTFEPEVVIHTDFAVELESGAELDALLKAEAASVYSKQTVREEFKRRDVVKNDIDDKEEQQRIAEEQVGLAPEQQIDPRTGQPIAPRGAPGGAPKPGLPNGKPAGMVQ